MKVDNDGCADLIGGLLLRIFFEFAAQFLFAAIWDFFIAPYFRVTRWYSLVYIGMAVFVGFSADYVARTMLDAGQGGVVLALMFGMATIATSYFLHRFAIKSQGGVL